jgi:uncharacterized protein (DUF885 family)
MSLLAENSRLHPIRREQTELRTFALNGYLEGWAEYAAGLCEEIGVYANPRDWYGRMTAERFAAARMMADTGINVWTGQQHACADQARRPMADRRTGRARHPGLRRLVQPPAPVRDLR